MSEKLEILPAQQLEQALAIGRLSHAYLLVGGTPEEKLETARRMAAALNCTARREGRACGLCPSCRQVFSGNHPDFHYLEPRGASLKIDQVRKLEIELKLKAFQGRAKVAVLNRVEDLTLEAANCLLKILEEPPPNVYFFLLATQPDAVLPTICSRCQILYFPSQGFPSVGWLYWQEILASDLRRLMLEILPRLEKEEDILAIVEGLSLACREHLVWELTGEERLMLTYKDLPGNRRVAPAALWRCYQHLSRARVYLEQNANRRLVLEVTLLNLYRELTSRSL